MVMESQQIYCLEAVAGGESQNGPEQVKVKAVDRENRYGQNSYDADDANQDGSEASAPPDFIGHTECKNSITISSVEMIKKVFGVPTQFIAHPSTGRPPVFFRSSEQAASE